MAIVISRLGRVTSWALLIAGLSGGALVVAGFTVPAYESSSVSSSGTTTQGARTLVEVNGLDVLWPLSGPLMVTLVVAAALSQRRRRGALPFAWTLVGLLAVLNLLALLSIGLFLLPVTASLVVACASAGPAPSAISAERSGA